MRLLKKRRGMEKRKAFYGYLFTLPWLIGFLSFTLYPLASSLHMSLNKVQISAEGINTTFVGTGNLIYALTLDFEFLEAVIETGRFVIVLTPLIVILALILAMLLNKKLMFRTFFRAIYFLPVIIISGGLMSSLEKNGVFDIIDLTENGILRWMNYTNFRQVYLIIELLLKNIFSVLWFSGVQILIYLSGLQKLDQATYEAAYIDGASSWQVFWKLTFPAMKQFTTLNIVYTIVLLATFPSSKVVALIKSNMFGQGDYQGLGYSSALAWIYFVMIILIMSLFLLLTGIGKERKRVR
ncbi:MAG: transporter permease [Herbinix sp.]|jgi:ABC-type sugar transport system permease subunit|nr:transporter permease [Herbinix sp.]